MKDVHCVWKHIEFEVSWVFSIEDECYIESVAWNLSINLLNSYTWSIAWIIHSLGKSYGINERIDSVVGCAIITSRLKNLCRWMELIIHEKEYFGEGATCWGVESAIPACKKRFRMKRITKTEFIRKHYKDAPNKWSNKREII